MICDNSHFFFKSFVFFRSYFLNSFYDWRKKRSFKNICLVFYCRQKSLETSAKIYILVRQFSKSSVFFFNVFHKYGVSNFKKSSALAVWMTILSKFFIMRGLKIKKHFAIRSSRFTRWHVFWRAGAGPPVFIRTIKINSFFWVKTFFFYNFCPNFFRIAVTRYTVISFKNTYI